MLALLACAATRVTAGTLPLVFAAASLKSALDAIALTYPMRLNYGGSGLLARQIIQGAPADIFVSANPEWMEYVGRAGKLQGAPLDLLSNRLVLIGSVGAFEVAPEDIVGRGRVAMGFVNAVPAGQYAKAALDHLGLWEAVEKQTVQTDNARAALALVARGEVPFGVVYASDAVAEPRVAILHTFATETHPKIIYQAGLIGNAKASLDGLSSETAKMQFSDHGFLSV
ncbi:MAG: molybdate ABC transporter substrate-binding protein [Litoreibacter sp.]